MSVPNSVEDLLSLIRKSGMVDEARLGGWLERRTLAGEALDDPRHAADAMIADGILTNFQAEQFLLGKWRGFTIGKFKLLERVGVGGMGQVFLCEHMFMKRRVAVKVLPPAKAEHPAALGRFYREARAAGLLEHSNIVRTHDIDQDGNLHFIVMEYVDGSNLLDIVRKFGPMDIGRATNYMRQVAIGLDYAFRNGIIHRDVKPGNVLIDRRGTAKVLDLGLARFFKDQSDNLTVKYDDKIVLGTADYVAPEQVANSHNVDVRADIYALGATFYFVLAGHPPFPSGTVSQKLIWHRTKDPAPIRKLRPEVPEAIAAIIDKLMAKDPAQRYSTPGEVADALAPLVPANVIVVPPPGEMPQLCPAVLEWTATTDTVSEAERTRAMEDSRELVGAAVSTGSQSIKVESRIVATAATVKPVTPISPFGSGVIRPGVRSSSPFTSPSSRPFGSPLPPLPDLPGPIVPRLPRASSATALFPPAPLPFHRDSRHDSNHRNRALAIALIAASLVVAGGIAFWKYVHKPDANPPAQVEPQP